MFKQLEKSEQDKYDLQRRLKLAENGGAYAAQKVHNVSIFVNFIRSSRQSPIYVVSSPCEAFSLLCQTPLLPPRSY